MYNPCGLNSHEVYNYACDELIERCMYGKPGDRLWVRETFCELDTDHYWDDSKPKDLMIYNYKYPCRNGAAYKAEITAYTDEIRKEYGYKWKPSIHMPRWASRILLEVTDVRVERVQDITNEDVYKEGIRKIEGGGGFNLHNDGEPTYFKKLWNSINAKRKGCSWNDNPWVWVVEFKRVEAGK